MERSCNNCRYSDFPVDALPCSKCQRCSCESDATDNWAISINEISDPFEKIGALAELQGLMLFAMIELHEKLDSLIEEVHSRN